MDGQLGTSFGLDEGVRQGCPASPTVFSLYMDRLEAFLAAELSTCSARERAKVRFLGMMLPLMLFADDIVLLARDIATMRRLLAVLASFCKANGLTVNGDKTKWMLL